MQKQRLHNPKYITYDYHDYMIIEPCNGKKCVDECVVDFGKYSYGGECSKTGQCAFPTPGPTSNFCSHGMIS